MEEILHREEAPKHFRTELGRITRFIFLQLFLGKPYGIYGCRIKLTWWPNRIRRYRITLKGHNAYAIGFVSAWWLAKRSTGKISQLYLFNLNFKIDSVISEPECEVNCLCCPAALRSTGPACCRTRATPTSTRRISGTSAPSTASFSRFSPSCVSDACESRLYLCGFFQAYSALGSADRPWRHTGSITSGVPTTGYEVLANPHIQKIADKVRDNHYVDNYIFKGLLFLRQHSVHRKITERKSVASFFTNQGI